MQNSALRQLVNRPKYIVCKADKNMGTVLIERDKIIHQVIKEHLGNKNTYRQLNCHETNAQIRKLSYHFDAFTSEFKTELGGETTTFLHRSKRQFGHNISKFRATIKVHKNPPKTRPVVATCGTYLGSLSKWLDQQLQALMTFLPWCTKDSQTLRDELIPLEIPNLARLFSFDAVSMYSNIDLDHAM